MQQIFVCHVLHYPKYTCSQSLCELLFIEDSDGSTHCMVYIPHPCCLVPCFGLFCSLQLQLQHQHRHDAHQARHSSNAYKFFGHAATFISISYCFVYHPVASAFTTATPGIACSCSNMTALCCVAVQATVPSMFIGLCATSGFSAQGNGLVD